MRLEQVKRVHFIGIGGIGMSALARYFNQKGCRVTGYDKTRTELTDQLVDEGISVYYHDTPSYGEMTPDLVVFTPAVPKGHPEFTSAENLKVPILKRSEILGRISQQYKTIAVAGTHGKTTTSTMIASIMHHSGFDVTAILGGISKDLNGNFSLGHSQWLVTEADEYDRSFLRLSPSIAVINSLDADHLDVYGHEDDMVRTYAEFARCVSDDGMILVRSDLRSQLEGIDPEVFQRSELRTFGKTEEADYRLNSLDQTEGKAVMNWTSREGVFQNTLPLAGEHNAMNALVAMAVCCEAGMRPKTACKAMGEFKGIHRRFEKIIETEDVVIIDDYAHHPTEISETIKGVKWLYPSRRIIGVFQAHLYSRTRDFMEDFAKALSELDVLYSCELYPAREEPLEGISGKTLFDKVSLKEKYFMPREELGRRIEWKANDVILIMGAGNIYSIINELKNRIEQV